MDVTLRYHTARYDGTNGAAVVAQTGGKLVSDTGTLLTFTAPDSNEFQLEPGRTIVWADLPTWQAQYIVGDAELASRFAPLPEPV